MPRRRPPLALAAAVALGALASGLPGLVPSAHAQYFRFGKNRVQYEALDWRYVQSEHFDVYFYERDRSAPGGRVLADFTARAAEAAYRDVRSEERRVGSEQITRRARA